MPERDRGLPLSLGRKKETMSEKKQIKRSEKKMETKIRREMVERE